ncbi:MAG: DNA polymerase III subunit alpha, partial [Saprospiraceae bacterium]
NFKPENREALLIHEPARAYSLPQLTRSPYEDAFDEIELLSFSVSFSPFELLKTKYRGSVKTQDLVGLDKQRVRLVGYLISIKHVPIKRGMMNFGTWIDANGDYFDTTHWPDSLDRFPFRGGGCYLLEGRVDVDFGFPSIVVEKMGKLAFIADPRYEDDKDMRTKTTDQLKSDISMTHRAPYPSSHEIGLPRHKMKE